MGSALGGAMKETMDENMKKNQEFMLASQKLQMARQLQMQNLMREKQMSMMLAGSREMFTWIASFYSLATLGMFAGFLRTKKPSVVVPFLPLSFIVAYQYDYCYGHKIDRIRAEAERILEKEYGLLSMPEGMPTFEDIENARKAAEGEDK
ncbi:predicted protein [Nematostella vectensis]|uniref:Plasminogen receptor (KT) n=1 Tax=Nematostella vectensis TaxID=45351 RepID=A7RXB5_NEMVE|nr:predicted protein [Nematostella vectensis]|eukprot:XP_001636064.1 predicted protein [Nematostella vectensis]